MDHVLASPSTSVSGAASLSAHEAEESATEDVGEDVVHPGPAPASFPQTLFSITIIQFLLFRVSEHLIGKADFFKLDRKKKILQHRERSHNINKEKDI